MNDEDVDVYDVGELIANSLGLELHCGFGCEYFYIGKSWSSIKDDETGKQFKEHIEVQLRKIFSGITFDTHEEAFRDG